MYMRLTSAGNLPISVFLALGLGTTGYNCYKAEPKERKDVFVRSSTIVGSSIIGVIGAQKYADKIIKQKPIEKSINTVAEWILHVPKPKFLKHFFESLLDANNNHKLDIEEHSQCNEIIQTSQTLWNKLFVHCYVCKYYFLYFYSSNFTGT